VVGRFCSDGFNNETLGQLRDWLAPRTAPLEARGRRADMN